ncbi:MAG: UMP kinase [Armatimonadetes bacterium]|nr:MAG: UMP kinase [Armatimonadota bacterium]GIV01328.1 MAG: uridylate kinase [Fimbriimonadales bacterium]
MAESARQRVAYKRVLLKLSGEVFSGPQRIGIDPQTVNYLAGEVVSLVKEGIEVAVVVGGGNFVRGEDFSRQGGIDQAVADYMGMLATIMNAMALQEAMERLGCPTRVMSAIEVKAVCEPFIRRRAVRHLEKGRAVVLAAGTGNPFFTTDTAAVLRALELGCDVLFKATKVDGVYDKDPIEYPDASRYEYISFDSAIEQRLAVMDQTAFTMCREHTLPIVVLSIHQQGALLQAAKGGEIGTLVGE